MAYQGPPGQSPNYGPPGYTPPPGYSLPPGYPPPPPPKKSNTALILVIIGVGVLALFGGCTALVAVVGSSASQVRTAPAATAPPIAEPSSAAEEPSQQPEVTASAQPEQTARAKTKSPKPKAPAVEKAVLPNVVGMNLQEGQDTMQAAGFYFLDDQDDTGQHRFQIYDRNWVVTRQVPAAGRRVPITTKVVLWAKKIGE